MLVCLCPLGFLALQAQPNSFFIGGTGGINFSKFRYTEDLSELYTTTNRIFGINGGVQMGFEIQNFTLSTGARYIQKGGEYQTDNFEDGRGVGFFSAKEKLHFVSIPILIGYRKYLSDNFGFTFAMGPSINVGLAGKINEKVEYFGSEDISIENYQVEYGAGVNMDYKKTQMGFQISPGFVFPLNHKAKLTFNVTWDLGTSDSFNPRYKDANEFFINNKGSQKNRSALFTLGYEYHFPFGDKY